MRICILATALDSFKGGNHLPLLAALRNVSFTIVTGRAKLDGPLPPNVEVRTVAGVSGSYYYGIADRRFVASVLRELPPSDAFWTRFDVLHCNQTMSADILRLRETGRPLLYTVHHPVSADLAVAREESGFVGKIAWSLKYVRLVAEQSRLCREMPCIVTVSETVRRRLVDDYGCAAERIAVVPNGVDGTEFRPSEESPSFDVIAVGSLIHPRKGFRYLVDVYRALGAAGYRIADLGRRSGAQQDMLRSVRGVTVYGTVPHERLVSLMRSSSALVSTSLYEGFGLSLIEALACGRPAFAFGCGAVPEVLEPIDPTLVVQPRDTQALVARLTSFLALPAAERDSKGKAYRERVLSLYSMEKAAAALRDVYDSVSSYVPH